LSIWEKLLGQDNADVSIHGRHLEAFYRTMEWFYPSKLSRDEADVLYKKLHVAVEKSLGPNARELATNLDYHARLYFPWFVEDHSFTESDFHQAESLFRRSLAIRERALGPNHADVAESLDNLASLYKCQGKHAKVEPLYRRALAIREMAPEPNDWRLFTSLSNLTSFYEERAESAKLEPLYLRAVAIYEKRLVECGPDSVLLPRFFLASNLLNLAKLYRENNRQQEALELEARAEALLADPYGRNSNIK
jgi:tetratricopeptide (TPR) repeat protein